MKIVNKKMLKTIKDGIEALRMAPILFAAKQHAHIHGHWKPGAVSPYLPEPFPLEDQQEASRYIAKLLKRRKSRKSK